MCGICALKLPRPTICLCAPAKATKAGGWGGIRTLETLAGLPVFKTLTRPLITLDSFVFCCNPNCLEVRPVSPAFTDLPTQCANLCQAFSWHSKLSALAVQMSVVEFLPCKLPMFMTPFDCELVTQSVARVGSDTQRVPIFYFGESAGVSELAYFVSM